MSEEIELKMTYRAVPVASVPQLVGTGAPKNIDETAQALRDKLGESALKSVEKSHKGDPYIVVDSSRILDALRFLRNDERFLCTMLQVIGAVDYLPKVPEPVTNKTSETPTPTPEPKAKPGYIAVVYVLWSFQHRHQITIQAHLDRDQPKLPSVVDLYRAANWYERECFDMLGVIFENHPDPTRILLPSDWVGYPLRRDYIFPEEYNGMKVPL